MGTDFASEPDTEPTAAPTADAAPSGGGEAPLTPRSFRGSGTLAVVARPRDARPREARPRYTGTGEPSGPEPVTRFTVEVEEGLRVERRAFADFVERTLLDRRSWGAQGGLSLQRVDSGPVDFSVVLAGPDTTDELCAPLETNGIYSCYWEGKAVLNARRWARGAGSYGGRLARYRRYMVNHEVGHALGHGHRSCPAAGEPAPVMLQQTKGLQGCRPNPWPLPAEL